MILRQVILSAKKPNKVITSQSEADNLVIENNDFIRFNAGTYDLSIAGNADNVTIEGKNATIRASEDVSADTWTDQGSYYSTPKSVDPKWITKNTSPIKMAETDWITINNTGDSSTLSINHSDVSSYTNIVGSFALIRHRVFRTAYLATVTGYNGAGTVTIDRSVNLTDPTGRDCDFKLLNDVEYFSGNQEFVWRNNTLYIKDSASPSTFNYRSLPNDHVINLNGDNNKITNLTIQESYNHLILSDSQTNLTVRNCTLKGSKGAAIAIGTTNINTTITSCTAYDWGYNGIVAEGSIMPLIYSNTIYDIGMQHNPLFPFDQNFAEHLGVGIALLGSSVSTIGGTVFNNTIYNMAYNGITCVGVGRAVYQNHIYDVCQFLEDGGGIYTWAGRDIGTNRAEDLDFYSNYIHDIPEPVYTSNAGIYFDNGSYNCKARNNVIFNSLDKGILQNPGCSDIEKDANTIVGSKINIRIAEAANAVTYPIVENEIMTDNILCVTEAASENLKINTIGATNPYSPNGEGDRNYYVNPYETKVANINDVAKTLTELRLEYSEDANSTEVTDYITAPGDPDNEILLTPNPSSEVLNGTAPAGIWEDVDGNTITNYSIASWDSLLLLKK